MSGYTRGHICGVDNCPSRLWKRVDGRNVCQYGHINEHDIEINDDDEMMAGGGGNGGSSMPGVGDFSRRLGNVAGLTTSQAVLNKVQQLSSEKNSSRKYGEDFKKLQARCYQIILAKNTKFIINKLNLSPIQEECYIKIVMTIWCKILDASINRRLDTKHKYVDISYLQIINYLAIIQMNIPMYLSDYINLTYNNGFNLERTEYCLPKRLRIQIPISQLSSFHGHLNLNYFNKLNSRFITTYMKKFIKETEINYYPFLLRTILNLFLPIEICKMYKNCVDFFKIKFTFNEMMITHIHPELKMLALLIIITKIYFSQKENSNNLTNWYHKYLKYKNSNELFTLNSSFIHMKKVIYYESTFEHIYNWDQSFVDEFIQFYETSILPNISVFNIASSNEYSDRNKLKIAKSIKDLFKSSIDPQRDDVEVIEQNQSEYMEFLIKVYNDTDVTNETTEIEEIDITKIDSVLGEHILCFLQCNQMQLSGSIKQLTKQLSHIQQ